MTTASEHVAAGTEALQQQQYAQGAKHFEAALNVDPSSIVARHHLALCQRHLGNVAEAQRHWQHLLQSAPTFAWAPAGLGNLLRAQAMQATTESVRAQTLAQARAHHLNALALDPLQSGHAHNLFLTLATALAWDEAATTFTRYAENHTQAAHFPELAARALVRLGRFDEALALAQSCLALEPTNADALVSQASCLRELGQAAAAEASLQRACELQPNHTVAAFNLAQLRCFRGKWAEGLAGIAEDRRQQVNAGQLRAPGGLRLWQGESDPQAHLLILAEQGLGDCLQLIRYAHAARARVGRVTLVPPSGLAKDHAWLQPLLRNVDGLDEVLRPSDPVPVADVFVPLFSLPHLCGPDPNKLWAAPRYVHADPALVQRWGQALGPRQGELRVALAWQGNPQYRGDQRRSLPLASFAPLINDKRRPVRWLSVQKGFGAQQLQQWPSPCLIEDWGARLDLGSASFIDTAALLEHVDLVITSDTSLPHLAGALGRPTWTLLAAVPDWRWQESGDTCPWYPSMRLFRQPRAGDWPGAVGLVKRALQEFAAP